MIRDGSIFRSFPQPLNATTPEYSIVICCYRIEKPDPLVTMRRIIFYDAFVLGLDALLTIVYIYLSVNKETLWLSAVFELLVCLLMLFSLRGLEGAIKAKQLSQKMYCYNCFRVFYLLIIQISSIGYLLQAGSDSNHGRNKGFLSTWGIGVFLLAFFGLILQPAIYSLCRAFTSTHIAFPQTRMYIIQTGVQPIYQAGPFAAYHPSGPHLSPVYGQPVYPQGLILGGQPAPVPFEEISLIQPVSASSAPLPYQPSQQVQPLPVQPYRPGQGLRTIDQKAAPTN